MLLAAGLVGGLCLASGPVAECDTGSYYQAVDAISAQGFDLTRTPGYPICIWLSFRIFGYQWQEWGLVLVQLSAFLLSIPALWAIARGMLGRRWPAAIVTALYALAPGGAAGFVPVLLTESITASFAVFVAYFSYVIYKGGLSAWAPFGLFVSLAALLSLRPAMTAVIPAGLVLLAALFLRRAALRYWAVIAVAAALLPTVFQTLMVRRAAGVSAPSVVGATNSYMMARDAAIPLDSFCSTPEMARAFAYYEAHPADDFLTEYQDLASRFGHDSIAAVCARAGMPWRGLGDRLCRSATDFALYMDDTTYPSVYNRAARLNLRTPFAWVPFWVVYAVLALSAAAIVWQWMRSSRAPWFEIVLWTALAGVLSASILLAPNHFDRLLMPALPWALLLAAWSVQADWRGLKNL